MLDYSEARAGLAIMVLGFAALTDLRWRRAPDQVWWILGAGGALLLLPDLPPRPDAVPALVTSLILGALVYGSYRIGLMHGGADAKAILALSIALPDPVGAQWAVPLGSPMPLSVVTILWTTLLILLFPLAFAAINLARGRFRLPQALLGIHRPLSGLDEARWWPLLRLKDDRVVTTVWPRRQPLHELIERGVDSAWVTPKIPLLTLLLPGLLLALVFGDPLTAFLTPRFGAP